MAIALNKSSLKQQQDQLKLFKKFLPSLELKRQQLMQAFKASKEELENRLRAVEEATADLRDYHQLLGSSTVASFDFSNLVKVSGVKTTKENVVGVMLPSLDVQIDFTMQDYSPLAVPFWVDLMRDRIQEIARLTIQVKVQEERVRLLDYAARKITQRVNLFEKVLIPRAQENIRRIRIFLGDQERAAVVRSKIAKKKNEAVP